MRAPGVPPVLALGAEPISGGRWAYRYSINPGQVVTLIVMPGPGMLPATDPAFAVVIDDLMRS